MAMQSMIRMTRGFAVFSLLMAFFALALPSVARADDPSTDTLQDQCEDGQVNQALQSAFGHAGQAMIRNNNSTLDMFGAIDVRVQSCLDKIRQAFQVITMLSDPLALIAAVVLSQVLQMIEQLCQTVLSDVTSLRDFALSQLNRICIPIPNFGLGGGGGLNLPKAPECNGIAPLQMLASPTLRRAPTYNASRIMPQRSRTSGSSGGSSTGSSSGASGSSSGN